MPYFLNVLIFSVQLPSMKKAKNVDERTKSYLPSMKRAVFVDGSPKTDVSSMKTAENVDGSPKLMLTTHQNRFL